MLPAGNQRNPWNRKSCGGSGVDALVSARSSARVRPSADRFVTRSGGVLTRHAFSFGRHYDPAYVGHGSLVVCDEHELQPGAGFAAHPHRDLEIISWVLQGELVHSDDRGTRRLPVGVVQRLGAGSGVVHAERAGKAPVRFLQMWLLPARLGVRPSYEQVVPPPGPLVTPLSGLGHPAAAPLGASAALHVVRLAVGERVQLPAAPLAYLAVTRGTLQLEEHGPLAAGDGAALTGAGRRHLLATRPAEALMWEMQR